jgi:hypothetical protein
MHDELLHDRSDFPRLFGEADAWAATMLASRCCPGCLAAAMVAAGFNLAEQCNALATASEVARDCMSGAAFEVVRHDRKN